MDYLKEFTSKLQSLDRSKNTATVFKDFLTLCTCSLAQPFYHSDKLEQTYLNTVKTYTKEQANEFSQLLALLVSALESEFQDSLGKAFMALNLGNARNGQFFTPYHVSKMMAEITFIDSQRDYDNKDIITLSEPCCGAGGMIIAYAQTLKEHKINYQNKLFVEAIDIDEQCFMMTYIQLALYGIPAKVMLGDTIAYKFNKVLYTPFYFLSGMQFKLKQNEKQVEKLRTKHIEFGTQLNIFDCEVL